MAEPVKRWTSQTKRAVVLILLLLAGLILYRFRQVLPPLVIACLLAFIFDPVADFLERRARLSRTVAALLVILILFLVILAAPAVAVPPLVGAISSLNVDFAQILATIAVDWDRLTAHPVVLLGQELDLQPLREQVNLRSLFGQLVQGTQVLFSGSISFVVGFASTVLWFLFTMLATFYLVRDGDRLVESLDRLVPSPLQDDLIRLRQRITGVWQAFLRGQLLMALLIGVITMVVASIIGLPNALALGLLAGVLEFVPSIGPFLAAVPAVLIALFQGSTWLPVGNLLFAVIVVALYVIIQQVENNLLLPRVMGQSLNLHPLVVLVAVIAGGILAGVLGILVAAPTVATLRVLAEYVFCRLTDRDPFPEAVAMRPRRRGWLLRLWDRIRRRALAGQWTIRPALPQDRAAVEAICAQAWDGDDYIPDVWDEWIGDLHGELTVVERRGRVAALAKLTRIADDEWWMEGLRVDPAYRRLGLARLLQAYQLRLAERVGRGVVRLATASNNQTVHRLAARDGFSRVARYLYYGADPLPGVSTARVLAAGDLDAAWALIHDSPVSRAAAGLYEVSWRWMRLTRERLAAHLAAGEVLGMDLEGRLAAAAIVTVDEGRDRLLVGYLDGRTEGITALAWCLRVLAGQRGYQGLRIRPPDQPALRVALEAAGVVRAWEHELWIFERPLQAQND